jgi:hypothetical protein
VIGVYFGKPQAYLNCDYDRVLELANNHNTLRQMLGHCRFSQHEQYKLQTIKGNIMLLTPDILDQISRLVVGTGHPLFQVENKSLVGRCDFFRFRNECSLPN